MIQNQNLFKAAASISVKLPFFPLNAQGHHILVLHKGLHSRPQKEAGRLMLTSLGSDCGK